MELRLKCESVKIVHLSLTFICLLFLCSCATEHPVLPQLPPAVTMNKGAGRGGHLIATLRLKDGEKLPFVVDTGSPVTLFDKSLEPELGNCFGPSVFSDFGVELWGGRYAAPKLYLGNTPLVTGSRAYTCNLKPFSSAEGCPIAGVLGMDCLRHYCIQLNFQTEKMRFLDSNGLDTAKLGQAFPLAFSRKGQGILGFFMDMIRPFIHHSGLFGGGTGKLLIDTGAVDDGQVDPRILHKAVRVQKFVLTIDKKTWFPKSAWNGATYANLLIGKGENSIGLRFLARFLVTFDFPKRMMYLKQTRIDPLASDSVAKFDATRSKAEAMLKSASKFMDTLNKDDQLPGWLEDDKGSISTHFDFPGTYPESITFIGRRIGNSSIYHYTITRSSKNSPWKLQKAWRTDAKERLIKEYPIRPKAQPR